MRRFCYYSFQPPPTSKDELRYNKKLDNNIGFKGDYIERILLFLIIMFPNNAIDLRIAFSIIISQPTNFILMDQISLHFF